MNTKMKMRLLSILLCLVMLTGLIPTTVFAWTAPSLSGGKAEWNVQLSDEGVLTWNDMGGTNYDIEVDKTAMGSTLTKIYGINNNSYNLINRFKDLKVEHGSYYFTIKTTVDSQEITSGDINFRYISPESKLSEPLNLCWNGTVAKWDSVDGATEYNIKLMSDSGSVQLSKTTTKTQYDWSTNVYNDGFWFEVVAIGDNYRNSNAAESPKYGNYSWTAPTLSGGKAAWNVQLTDDGMLRWNDMGNASYDIYVDETAMGGTVTNIYNINTNAYNLINRFKTLKLENGTYYFTIKANDTSETSGDIRFTYVSPESKLSAPQNLRWDGTVAKWDSVTGATEYDVKLISDSGYVQLSKTTTETQYDWNTYVANGYWFEVVATATNYRDSNAAESPKYGTPLAPNTYTVTYDANGGTGTMASENLTVDKGFAKTYTFPECGFTAPNGKEFDKWLWYYDSNPERTNEIAPGNSPWLSGSITVKALWKDKAATYYTVTYDANGGSGSMATENLLAADDLFVKNFVFPECSFVAPDGKEFDKWLWYYESNPERTNEITPGQSPWLSGNIVVKALWKDVEYNVTVTGGTASVGAGTPITKATMGTTVTLTATQAPSGQEFDKWVVNGVVVDDANSATTTFVMPACNVAAEATYKDAPHSHTPSSTWYIDETYHWKECTTTGCGVIIESSKQKHRPDRSEPTYDDAVKCAICGYVITPALSNPTVTLIVPFTKTVKQGGNVAPDAKTFTLEVFEVGNSNESEYSDVTVNATVSTNGKGVYDGTFTISGPERHIAAFVSEGFFVREKNDSAANWTYSDAVWYVTYEQVDNWDNTTPGTIPSDPEYALVPYATTVDDSGTGSYIPVNLPSDKMTFENTYTENQTDTDPTNPSESNPTDPTNPSESNPTDPTNPSESDPTDPINPSESDPTDPTNPSESNPTDPTNPPENNPTDPTNPSESTTDSTKPEGQSEQTEPTNPSKSNPDTVTSDSPQTGDNSNMPLWIILFFISGMGVVTTITLYIRRKKSVNKG